MTLTETCLTKVDESSAYTEKHLTEVDVYLTEAESYLTVTETCLTKVDESPAYTESHLTEVDEYLTEAEVI